MRKLLLLSCLAASAAFNVANVDAQTRTQQNTVKGGIAGAILGGIIGHQNDETGGGVAIGAALGALSGNAISRSQDQAAYRQQQALALQQQQTQQQLARSVSLDDAITMTRSGMSDNLIINQIRNGGVQQQVGVREVITLHQNGVSEPVIQALQAAEVGGAQTRPTYSQPVVVRQAPQVVVQPVPVMPVWHYQPRSRYHYHPPHRGHPRSSGLELHFRR